MKRIIILFSIVILAGDIYSQQMLTLEECRDLAIQNNKELQITATKIKGAEYQRKEAFTSYFPEVSASGTYLWLQKNIRLVDFDKIDAIGSLLPSNPILTGIGNELKDFLELDVHNIFLGNVRLVQPVFAGGKIVTYNQIARYAEDLARSVDDLTLQNVIYTTDQAYWQVISVANKKTLADAYVELLRKTYDNVDAMVEEGVATKAEALSVKVKLNEAEMAQTKAENGLSLSKMLLAKIIGLPIDSDILLADEKMDSFPVEKKIYAIPNVEEAWANRQEIRSLELATQIYRKKERLVLAEHLPTVGVTAAYMVNNPNGVNGFKNEFAGMWNAGVVVSVPISGWWGGTYKKNAARAETHIKRLELLEAKELIELEVNESAYKINEANKKLIASERNMESAQENLEYASYGFEEGVIPILNLMEAQTAWVAAKSDLIDSQIDLKLTEVYFTKALGKLTPDQIK